MSKQSLYSRKALNKIYTIDITKRGKKTKCNSSKRSSSSLIALVPKFAGCNPGGVNGNLMPKTFQNTSSQSQLKMINSSSQRKKNPYNIMRTNSDRQEFKKIRMDDSESNYDIKLHDKYLKKARQETTRIKNSTPDEPLEYNINEQK